jgi:hypothetical protein
MKARRLDNQALFSAFAAGCGHHPNIYFQVGMEEAGGLKAATGGDAGGAPRRKRAQARAAARTLPVHALMGGGGTRGRRTRDGGPNLARVMAPGGAGWISQLSQMLLQILGALYAAAPLLTTGPGQQGAPADDRTRRPARLPPPSPPLPHARPVCMCALQVTRQVDNGPVIAKTLYQLVKGRVAPAEGVDLTSLSKVHSFKNFKCARHDRFFGVDLLKAGAAANKHHMRLAPFERRDAAVTASLLAA